MAATLSLKLNSKFSNDKKINLSTSDYYFLYEWMQKLPRESIYPSYNDYSRYSDGYCKFFIFGDTPNKVPAIFPLTFSLRYLRDTDLCLSKIQILKAQWHIYKCLQIEKNKGLTPKIVVEIVLFS